MKEIAGKTMVAMDVTLEGPAALLPCTIVRSIANCHFSQEDDLPFHYLEVATVSSPQRRY